jgi:hypothetical protein
MTTLDRIDHVARQRHAIRLRRSHGDRSDETKLTDQRLTAELVELWREHRTTMAAKHIPRPLGTPR